MYVVHVLSVCVVPVFVVPLFVVPVCVVVLVRYQVLFDTDRYLNFVRYSILTL